MDPAIALAKAVSATTEASDFTALVRVHQAMVFSIAFHFLGDRAAAEETAQEVFLELFQRMEKLQTAEHILFWLRRVTVNRCINELRKRQRSPEVPLEKPLASAAPVMASDPIRGERLRKLVTSLPDKMRMMIVLRYQEDLDPADIAALTKMPLNTVKSQLQRALSMLRKKAGELQEEK